MKQKLSLVFVIAVSMSGASYAIWWVSALNSWNRAQVAASLAYQRVYEYRDSSVLVYEPRLKDFQVATDELRSLKQPTVSKQLEVMDFGICASALNLYRNGGDFDELRKSSEKCLPKP